MLYAAELGPIETSDEGALHIYIAFLDDEAMTPDAQATAADALEKMATLAASRGHTELLCEPSLAKAGKRFGFKSAKMPDDVALGLAMMAFHLSLGSEAGKPADPEAATQFLLAAAGFEHAAPWQYWWDSEAFTLVSQTSRKGKPPKKAQYECSLMGRAGEVFGLALYDKPGSLKRLEDFTEKGNLDAALKLGSIAMTLNAEPAWAIEALERGLGLKALPSPVRMAAGKGLQPVRDQDLRLLTAALVATAKLKPDNLEASAELVSDGETITVLARASAPVEE